MNVDVVFIEDRPDALTSQLITACPSAALAIEEGRYLARLINPADPEEVRAYQVLRYDYFVRQKGWIALDPQNPGIETDPYDAHAWHLAVFETIGTPQETTSDSPHLLAYLRVLPGTAPCGFMLDHEFNCLVQDEERLRLPRTGVVELSRLVIAPDACIRSTDPNGSHNQSPHVVEILLKLLFHLSRHEHWTSYYIVAEEVWLKTFARRFMMAFTPISTPCIFPDGTRTVAAYAELKDLEHAVKHRDPNKYRWYCHDSDVE